MSIINEERVPLPPRTHLQEHVKFNSVKGSALFNRLRYDPFFVHALIQYGPDQLGTSPPAKQLLRQLHNMVHPGFVNHTDAPEVQKEIDTFISVKLSDIEIPNQPLWKLFGNRDHILSDIQSKADSYKTVAFTGDKIMDRSLVTTRSYDGSNQLRGNVITTLPWTLHLLASNIDDVKSYSEGDVLTIGPTKEHQVYGQYQIVKKATAHSSTTITTVIPTVHLVRQY